MGGTCSGRGRGHYKGTMPLRIRLREKDAIYSSLCLIFQLDHENHDYSYEIYIPPYYIRALYYPSGGRSGK
jgi:hypothetical protein